MVIVSFCFLQMRQKFSKMKQVKKNRADRYAQDMQNNEKTLHISFWKALSIVATVVLTTIVGTAFTIFNTGVSNHFVLVRAVDDIEVLKTNTVSRGELIPRIETLESDIKDIKLDIKDINQDIKDIHKSVVR
jgi:5-bromo-4-chloroindolyl phosphate hydrolysis protein